MTLPLQNGQRIHQAKTKGTTIRYPSKNDSQNLAGGGTLESNPEPRGFDHKHEEKKAIKFPEPSALGHFSGFFANTHTPKSGCVYLCTPPKGGEGVYAKNQPITRKTQSPHPGLNWLHGPKNLGSFCSYNPRQEFRPHPGNLTPEMCVWLHGGENANIATRWLVWVLACWRVAFSVCIFLSLVTCNRGQQ